MQPDEHHLYLNKTTYPEQVEKRRSDRMQTSLKDQLGIVAGFLTRMHPAHASIGAMEAEIQARRSTSIVIVRCWQKRGRRMCNAWTDNLVAANMRCHIWYPVEKRPVDHLDSSIQPAMNQPLTPHTRG